MGVVEFDSVSKSYRGKAVLEDFSLLVEAGERVVILGPSGCGKTTVLRLLAGFIAPDSGSISIDGEVVAAAGIVIQPPERRGLGMVFQDMALWPHITVEGNLMFGLKAQHIPKLERIRRTADMLALVQMETYRNVRPSELSGGQQQRVALARALILKPSVLLMDEALSNLDESLNLHLRKELLHLHSQLGFTLIFVTHDQGEAREIGTRILHMRQGFLERIGTGTNATPPGVNTVGRNGTE